MSEFCRKSLLLISILAVMILPAAGQAKTGTIKIEVRDQFGNAMEAGGKLEGTGTGLERSFQTSAEGTYNFDMLPFGRYRLEVSKDGFATQSVLIDVQSEVAVSRVVTLAVGASAYRVDVISAT